MKNSLQILVTLFLFCNPLISSSQCIIENVKSFNFFIAGKDYTFNQKSIGKYHEYSSPFGIDTLTFIYWCENDTTYWTRKPLLIDKANNGFMIFGLHKLPNKPTIGQSLPLVSDMVIYSPITKESRSNVNTMYTDYYNGNSSDLLVTTIKTFNVATKTTVNMNTENVSMMNSKVVGQEEIVVGEQKYMAFKVEYEIWSKAGLDVKFEYDAKGMNSSDQKQINEQNDKINKRLKKQMEKYQNATTNKKGYNVIPRTDWYVPTLGWVKANTYDSQRIFEKDKAYISKIVSN
jgi:hypothetical protein